MYKRLYPNESVKYLGVKINTNLSWQHHFNDFSIIAWSQDCSTIQLILILQKKAVRIINFQPKNSYTKPLFKHKSVLKFQDKICLENILFGSKSLINLSPSVFITLLT